jgi:hypothetical protein
VIYRENLTPCIHALRSCCSRPPLTLLQANQLLVEQGDWVYTRPVLDGVAKRNIPVPSLAEELEPLNLKS